MSIQNPVLQYLAEKKYGRNKPLTNLRLALVISMTTSNGSTYEPSRETIFQSLFFHLPEIIPSKTTQFCKNEIKAGSYATVTLAWESSDRCGWIDTSPLVLEELRRYVTNLYGPVRDDKMNAVLLDRNENKLIVPEPEEWAWTEQDITPFSRDEEQEEQKTKSSISIMMEVSSYVDVVDLHGDTPIFGDESDIIFTLQNQSLAKRCVKSKSYQILTPPKDCKQ